MRFKAKNKQGIKRKRKRGKRKEMGIKLFLLILFFAVMVGVGFYSRRHVNSVDGFVLGGRSVGPWLTAFAYNLLFFCSCICRICGTVWMEIRNCKYLDRNRECIDRKSAGMGYSWKKNEGYDAASECKDNAGFFWTEVWKQIVKNRSIGDCVCVPDPVYSIRL